MSYVRSDDKDHDLTRLRLRLEGEGGLQIGEEFPIFLGRLIIQWGQNWAPRVVQSLNEVTFLFPIITPAYFKSTACRCEFKVFLDRERQLQRNDLILPIYYGTVSEAEEWATPATDELAKEAFSRQHADWRGLRTLDQGSRRVRKALADCAAEVRDALRWEKREQAPRTPHAGAPSHAGVLCGGIALRLRRAAPVFGPPCEHAFCRRCPFRLPLSLAPSDYHLT